MSVRALPIALLLCLALPAEARDARMASAGGDGSSCTADYPAGAAPDVDPARAARRQDSEKPAIPRGTTGTDVDATRPPRWHSFLPGMFR
ncbi:hypothetical protein [Luteimonas arsenica]|uniref:hypothetical protein n=1 Tax=Luteimonas arsenica TaxID=1586242 RepID=UPI001055FBDB|nr:hypothetical protein [Luteimonas arsenica]